MYPRSSVERSTWAPKSCRRSIQQPFVLVLRKDVQEAKGRMLGDDLLERYSRCFSTAEPQPKAGTVYPFATTALARSSCSYSSSVRAWTARARDVVPGPAVLSIMRTGTPCLSTRGQEPSGRAGADDQNAICHGACSYRFRAGGAAKRLRRIA